MSDIIVLYAYSILMFILTFATTNNSAPFITGTISVVMFLVATYKLVRKAIEWAK